MGGDSTQAPCVAQGALTDLNLLKVGTRFISSTNNKECEIVEKYGMKFLKFDNLLVFLNKEYFCEIRKVLN